MRVVGYFAKGAKGTGKEVFVASLHLSGVDPQKYLPG
jgi:hypothetical protein